MSVVLGMSLLSGVPASAAPKAKPHGPSTASVPVGRVRAAKPSRSATDGAGVRKLSHTKLPAGGSASVAVFRDLSGSSVVGGVGVGLSSAAAADVSGSTRDSRGPGVDPGVVSGSVRVSVLPQSVATAAGVHGVVLSLTRSGGAGVVRARFDYSGFANAFGADFGARLRVVSLPGCVLSTPRVASCVRETDLPSVNAGAGTVSADVPVGGSAPAVVALAAGSSSSDGSFTATSLSPAYSWAAGTSSGDFTYSYPLKVPASVGGPSPDLSLSYSSGSVDAQTLAANGQTSWVGEGWDLQTGYVERSYRTCSQDGGTTADACWFSQYNATLVFQGRSEILVRDNTSQVWHARDDSGLKVEDLTGASGGPGDNGTNNREYWRVTTLDGTQYYFGANHRYVGDATETGSMLSEPVFGNNAGEPCFPNSCIQGYRWNLDYVVDPRGNSMTYFYTRQGGAYQSKSGAGPAVLFDMSSVLDHVDYGTRVGSEASGHAPMRVVFQVGDRCINTCSRTTPADFPDTPLDQYCAAGAASCSSLKNMVYWSFSRLNHVYTQVWDPDTSGYRKVDQWDLGYTFPSTEDHMLPAGMTRPRTCGCRA
jgi:hypothetical protein